VNDPSPQMRRNSILTTVAMLCGYVALATFAQDVSYPTDVAKPLELDDSHELRKMKISESERTAIARAINAASWSRGNVSGPDSAQFDVLDTPVEMMDLNRDGVSEVIVQGLACSPTGNCAIGVLKTTASGYRVILDSIGQSISIQETRAGGFNEIVVFMHGSASSSTTKIYHYLRGRYRRVGCYNVDLQVLEDGEARELDEPRITPCGAPPQ